MAHDYALIDVAQLTVIKTAERAVEFPDEIPDLSNKGWKWVPLTDSPQPPFNGAIEFVERIPEVVTLDGVTRGWEVKKRDLATVISEFIIGIDQVADGERGKHGSEGTSKQAEYDQVADEARKRAIGNLADKDAILLQADVDAGLATDLDDAANKVIAEADAAKEKIAAIRLERRKKKEQVKVASTVDEVWTIFSGLTWPV